MEADARLRPAMVLQDKYKARASRKYHREHGTVSHAALRRKDKDTGPSGERESAEGQDEAQDTAAEHGGAAYQRRPKMASNSWRYEEPEDTEGQGAWRCMRRQLMRVQRKSPSPRWT